MKLMRWWGLSIAAGMIATACASANSPSPVSLEPQACVAAVGEVATLYLFETSTASSCVMMGVHQRIDFFNKGFTATVVDWFGERVLASDAQYTTEAVGNDLEPGFFEVDGGPFEIPRILIIDPTTSPLTSATTTSNAFGDVTVGMTLSEASSALGLDIEIDRDLSFGPCMYGTVPGDPYSPIFGITDQSISWISMFYPEPIVIGSEVDCG
ncbi:MAG: hypothetical protein HKO76_08595 [Acidimicrobiia bacterium]|nr:hypothetical protein [Acidimicrobiia bacterium]